MEYGFSQELVYVFVFFYVVLGEGKCLQVVDVFQSLENLFFSSKFSELWLVFILISYMINY